LMGNPVWGSSGSTLCPAVTRHPFKKCICKVDASPGFYEPVNSRIDLRYHSEPACMDVIGPNTLEIRAVSAGYKKTLPFENLEPKASYRLKDGCKHLIFRLCMPVSQSWAYRDVVWRAVECGWRWPSSKKQILRVCAICGVSCDVCSD
jgi:hypothetical protein